jgi:predicted dehydrogenase
MGNKSKKVRIGILSTASIASKSVIPTLLKLSEFYTLVGVGGRTLSKTEEYCSNFNIKAFDSYDRILHEGNLDAVYIPLPNSMHFEWVMKALDLGLHVMCEKSLACTFEEVKLLVQKANEKDLLLMEHFQFRFHNQIKFISDLVKNDEIGEIRCLRSSFGLPPFPDENNIRYDSNLGGGALLDTAAYPIKISQLFLGSNLQIRNATLITPANYNVDIWGGAQLVNLENSSFSQIAFGFDHSYQNSLEIWGSKGRITTNRIFTAPPNFKVTINLEKQYGYQLINESIELEIDNHFENIWNYFYKAMNDSKLKNIEIQQNLNQARLIHELKEKSNEQ